MYPILSIVFFPSIIKKQCSCCLSPIHNDNGKYIEMLQMLLTTLLNSQDLRNLWNALVYMHIYYLLENTQQCKLPLSNNYGTIIYGKQTAVQPVWTGKFALHTKNRAIKRGLGRKNCAGKKSRRIRDEKRTMCEWDHWNSIGAIPTRYRGEFATSKTPQIRAVCVMSLSALTHIARFFYHAIFSL